MSTTPTTPITRFNKQTVNTFLVEAREALQAVADKHGLELTRGRCTYQQDRVKLSCFTVSTVETADDGTSISAAERDFRLLANSYGLSSDDFGAVFRDWNGKSFQIMGIKPRARKNTILAKNVHTGKVFVWPHAAVKSHLERTRAS